MRRPCLGWRSETCGVLVAKGNRCAKHQAEYERARRPIPSASARGYDHKHQATRAKLLPLAYGTLCPRCDEPMLAGQDLDLGHTVARAHDPRARADRIEHSACNRSAGVN